MTRSPFRKGYLTLRTAYKRLYAFEFSGQTFHEEMLHGGAKVQVTGHRSGHRSHAKTNRTLDKSCS